jgi:hypothetical protein
VKKSSRSLIAFTVLAMAMAACSVVSPKTETPQNNTQTMQESTEMVEVTETAIIIDTPEGEKPFKLLGIWKSDDLHAPDNSWNISYSVYFQFANTKQYVYHGVDTFNSNQPTDISDIVYLNISDSTFIKKLVDIPDHPEALGKFQKWTWRFDNGNVLFTVYGMMDTQDQALNDDTITALATGVKAQQSQTDTTPPPPSKPTATAIAGSNNPIAIGDFNLKISTVVLSDKGYNGMAPYPMTADQTVLAVEVSLISGDLGNLSKLEIWITDEGGNQTKSGSTLSMDAKNQVVWLFPVARTSHSFFLHFPSGEAIDLSPLLSK